MLRAKAAAAVGDVDALTDGDARTSRIGVSSRRARAHQERDAMKQFDNPSAVAPFRDGYLLLTGMGTGKDSRHGLQLQYGVVESPDQLPKYSTFQFLDQTQQKPAQTSIVTPNGVYENFVPYLFALDDSTIVAVYAGEEQGKAGVWAHVFYDDGATLNRVTAYQQLVTDLATNPPSQIGASTVPGQSGFITAYMSVNTGQSLLWCSLPAYTPGQAVNLNAQPVFWTAGLDSAYRSGAATGSSGAAGEGDQSFVAIVNGSGAGANGAPCIGVGVQIVGSVYVFWLAEIDFPSGGGTPTLASISSFSVAPGTKTMPPISLFRGADGLAWYQLAQTPFTIGQVSPTAMALVNTTTLKYDVSKPAPVYFTFGDGFETDLEPGQPPQTVPVYQTFLFDGSSGSITQIGQAQRTAWQQDAPPQQQGMLIGIIASGPPVPNQNIASLASGVTYGTTTFGITTANATGWSVNASLGGFFQVKGSVSDGIYSGNAGFKLSFGINSAFSRTTTTQQVRSFSGAAGSHTDQGNVVINPQGMALVYRYSFVGYMFQFLDLNGAPVAGSPPYYELYTVNPSMQPMPFDYPPSSSGAYPGNLLSYQVDQDIMNQYQNDQLNGASIAQFGWATSGSTPLGVGAISAGTKSVGATAAFEATVGATIGPPGNNLEITAGVTANFAFNYTWTTTETDTLQTVVNLGPLNDPPPPGAYAAYSYNVYLLAHSVDFTTGLIAMLNAYPTDENKQLLAAIMPSSAPWMMVHALTSYELAGSGVATLAKAG
jgi:hypothetical protein